MDLIEATMKALQGKLEEKPNKDNAEINSKILEPNANKTELQKNGYNVERADGFTTVKRADRKDDFREIDVFDDGTVITTTDTTVNEEPIKNKEAFDAKSFLDTKRKKPYEEPSKVSKFKINKDTIAQADEEIGKAEISKEEHPEDAETLDKNVIEPWKKLSDKANADNKAMLGKTESRRTLGRKYIERKDLKESVNDDEINKLLKDTDFMATLKIKPEDVKKQLEISKKEFDEISKYVAEYKGTFGELYKELGGWNLGDNNVEQDSDNLFDCYYKSLLITVLADDGKLSVSPHDVYVYAKDITDVDTDEILHIDFDKPIDFSKLTESKKVEDNSAEVDIKFDIQYDDEAEEPYYYIQCTDKDGNVIEQYGFDTVYNSKEEAQEALNDILNDKIKYGKLVKSLNKKITEEVISMDEAFYAKICKAYVNTANLEWVTTNPENNSVVHGYFADDDVAEKYDYGAKVTPKNFKDIAYEGHTEKEIEDGDVEWYDYDTWEDFYKGYVEDEIKYDMYDLGVYDLDEDDDWDFYISEEDLTKLGLWDEEIREDYLDESKKVEDYKVNAFNKSISVENENGDTLMEFKVSEDGNLYDFKNCDIADEEDDKIRVQQIGTMGSLGESKKQESVVSDYTLSEIKKVLDSEETEYGYSLKITNSGADAETKTLDLDKSDLQAIYDALSKNKVTESKLVEDDTDVFSKLNDEIKNLPDANLDYKGICSLIVGYIEGIVGIEDNPEAMSKINIDLIREIADAVFDEDNIWEPMDDFIYSSIYGKLDIDF